MLEELQKTFDKVRLKHFMDKTKKRNGKTIAVLHDGNMRYVGVSECGRKDCFSRKRGREIALNRAIHAKTSGKQNGLFFSFDITNEQMVPNIPEHLYINVEKTNA